MMAMQYYIINADARIKQDSIGLGVSRFVVVVEGKVVDIIVPRTFAEQINIDSITAIQGIVATAAIDPVVAFAAIQNIVTTIANKDIGVVDIRRFISYQV